MNAIDNARRQLGKFDEYKRTLLGRVTADDLADALRDVIAEHDRVPAEVIRALSEALGDGA